MFTRRSDFQWGPAIDLQLIILNTIKKSEF